MMEGPLAPWASGMAEHLESLGYGERLVERHMGLARQLSRFVEVRGIDASGISPEVVDEFCGTVRAKSGSSKPTARTLGWLVGYLDGLGVLAAPVPLAAPSPEEELVDRYRRYLTAERGVEPETVVTYLRPIMGFLAEHPTHELGDLGVSDVSRFVTRQCRHLSPRGAERLATALRSFFGFALLEGLTTVRLAGAVPSAARWSGAALPRGLAPGQVATLLASCDRRRPVGIRDYAILVLLSRLGLRAAEVSGLCLDDIDWRAGELVVRGKGRSEERLPLPCDVGEAIAEYLRLGRPRRPEREVFLRAVAPLRGLSHDGVGEVVRAASERAGLGSFGSHRLRHTAATEMLRAGASLPEVAQVLRHHSVATTVIYAKVDHLALRGLALPWPGSDR